MLGRLLRNLLTEQIDTGQLLQARLVSMLYEDFTNSVIPYRSLRDAYRLSADGPVTPRLFTIRPLREGQGVEDFIRVVASYLLRNFEASIEVAVDPLEGNSQPIRLSFVDGISPQSSGSDSARVVRVSLPAKYPRNVLEAVLLELAESSKSFAPDWAMHRISGQRTDTPRYDFEVASQIERRRVLQVALPIGWDAREKLFLLTRSEINEFYCALRELRFLHFVASMRECAEYGLQQVLDLTREQCGLAVKVTAHGVYTPDEIDESIRRFESGCITFGDVNRIIREEISGGETEQTRLVYPNTGA